MKRPHTTRIEAIQAFSDWVKTHGRIRPAQEPDWQAFVSRFQLGQPERKSLASKLQRLWLLPFCDFEAAADLFIFHHLQLPDIRRQAGEHSTVGSLARLFDALLVMVLQGRSPFPQNPTHIAQQIRQVLVPPTRKSEFADGLLALLIDPVSLEFRPGFNFLQAADLDLLAQYEHNRRQGTPEAIWRAKHKYDEYVAEVSKSAEFHADWQGLKQRYRVEAFRDADGVIRRSRIVEGDWREPTYSDLSHETGRFRVEFDFFCSKWFLYGLRGDEPMVQKLAVTVTPYGTSIFIPAFWSFDYKRDIDWKKLLRLHRARGIGKQGAKLAMDRQERRAQLKRLLAAEAEARKRQLRGAARYQFLKQQAGLVERTDDAQIRRMLRQARRLA